MTKPTLFNITGRYRITDYTTLPTGITHHIKKGEWKHNLITNLGNLYILNRFQADHASGTYKPVGYIVVGTKATPAAPEDTLEDITDPVYVIATATINSSPNYNITYLAEFTSAQLNGISCIGLITDNTSGSLITLNTFEALTVIPSQHYVEYEITLRPATVEIGWTATTGKSHTFEITTTYTPIFVDEYDPSSNPTGYVRKTSVTDVESNASSYYYDSATSKLYIHPSDGNNPDTSGTTILVTS